MFRKTKKKIGSISVKNKSLRLKRSVAASEFVKKLSEILNKVEYGKIVSSYENYENRKKCNMHWDPDHCIKTDCSGFVCGILRDCSNSKLKRFYRNLLEYSSLDRQNQIKHPMRKNLENLYPPGENFAVFTEDMFDFIKSIQPVSSKKKILKKGDLIVLKYSYKKNATGHVMVCWEDVRLEEKEKVQVLECSCKLNKIGLSEYDCNDLKNAIHYRF